MITIRSLLRKAIVVALTSVALVFALASAMLWSIGDGDPLDRFKLLKIVSSDNGRTHAAVFEYYHANSSATGTAVWLINGDRQAATLTERPNGDPVLAWFGDVYAIEISARHQRAPQFSVTVSHQIVARVTEYAAGCFLDYEQPSGLLCYDPKKIELLQSKQ